MNGVRRIRGPAPPSLAANARSADAIVAVAAAPAVAIVVRSSRRCMAVLVGLVAVSDRRLRQRQDAVQGGRLLCLTGPCRVRATRLNYAPGNGRRVTRARSCTPGHARRGMHAGLCGGV